jgi:molybdopterin adenylyltransferase
MEHENQTGLLAGIKFAVLTISDRCYKGEYTDKSGKAIVSLINNQHGGIVETAILPDEQKMIEEKLISLCDTHKADIIITTGGTGLGPRDMTPEATLSVADKIIPGIAELMRIRGCENTKKAMLSRAVCVLCKNSIIINLPGSQKGARESLSAILEILPHAIEMVKGEGHEGGKLKIKNEQ